MTKHVAAWDLPSLDYLSEEQTLKYLRKHEEDVRRREQLQLNNQGSHFAKITRGCVNSALGNVTHLFSGLDEIKRMDKQAGSQLAGWVWLYFKIERYIRFPEKVG